MNSLKKTWLQLKQNLVCSNIEEEMMVWFWIQAMQQCIAFFISVHRFIKLISQ